MYVNDVKIFAKIKEKEPESLIQTIRIFSREIGLKVGIVHAIVKKKERENTNNRRNRTTKSGKHLSSKGRRKLPVTWEYWKRKSQTNGDKR